MIKTLRTNPYNHRWWKTMRWAMMKETLACPVCKYRLADSVDHIVPWNWGGVRDIALFYNEQNLLCLCKTCHNQKTGYERANWRIYKTYYQAVIPKPRMKQIDAIAKCFGAQFEKKLAYLRAENKHLTQLETAKELSPLNVLWMKQI